MISDVIAFIELVHKISEKFKIISTLFSWDGKRIEGDEKIQVEKHDQEDGTWYYSIKDLDDYIFIRMPVNMSGVIERVGQVPGENSSDSKYFRYLPVPDGTIRGSPIPNVKVDFIVIGYKPKDILNLTKGKI